MRQWRIQGENAGSAEIVFNDVGYGVVYRTESAKDDGFEATRVVSIAYSMSEPTVMRQWIARAKSGDSAAFEQLLELHGRMVLRTAQRLLLNDADAQDAAQEVFLRLHRSLHKFQESRDMVPWLYRITVNICRDQRKRRKLSVAFDEAPEPAAREANPEQELNAQQRRSLLRAALAGLSERERDAIVLRDLEGLSTAEVARILGSTETTVRSQISMGRVKLRRRLQESMERKP